MAIIADSMRHSNLRTLLGTSVACLLGGISTFGATTTPVGAVSQEIVNGLQFISVPFQKPIDFQSTVSSVSGTVLGLEGVLTPTNPSYVQVLSGSAIGEIATISAVDATTVTLETEITGLLSGDSVAIREHILLSDLAEYISATDNDLVSVYNLDGSVIVAQYFTAQDFGWFDLVNNVEANSVPIMPGEGVVLTANGARTATYYGSVASSPVNQLHAGDGILSVVGTLNPVSGETIGDLFPLATDDDLLSIYTSVNGALVTQSVNQYFNIPGSFVGWFDLVNNVSSDGYVIGTGSAVFYQGVVPSVAVHPVPY